MTGRITFPGARPLVAAACALLLGLIAGCHAPPDLRPFAQGAAELQKGVAQTGASFDQCLSSLHQQYPPQRNRDRFNAARQAIAMHWAARDQAAASLANYADALAHLSGAGSAAGQNFDSLVAALDPLIGVADVYGGLGSAAKTAVRAAVQNIANGVAVRTLADAVEAADPAIAKIIELLQADLVSLRQVMVMEHLRVVQSIDQRYPELAAQGADRLDLQGAATRLNREAAEAYAARNPGLSVLERARAASDAARDIERRQNAYERELADAKATISGHIVAIDRLHDALGQFRIAHKQLGPALESRRGVSVAALIGLAEAVNAAIEEANRPDERDPDARPSWDTDPLRDPPTGRPEVPDPPDDDRPDGDRPDGDRPDGDRPDEDRPDGDPDRPGRPGGEHDEPHRNGDNR